MASHPDYLDAQLNGVDKIFIPGISDVPGPMSYTPIYQQATFQLKKLEHERKMSRLGLSSFGKRKRIYL